jgi:hypothetical protein
MAVNAASAFQPLAADSPRRGLAPRSSRPIRAVLHRRRQTAWRARPRALSARIARPVGVSWPRAWRQVGNRDTRSCSATDDRAGHPVRPSRTSLTAWLSGGQQGDPPSPDMRFVVLCFPTAVHGLCARSDEAGTVHTCGQLIPSRWKLGTWSGTPTPGVVPRWTMGQVVLLVLRPGHPEA